MKLQSDIGHFLSIWGTCPCKSHVLPYCLNDNKCVHDELNYTCVIKEGVVPCARDVQYNQVMKWLSVISAMFGITATAWIFQVTCLVMLKFRGNARLVVTVHDC